MPTSHPTASAAKSRKPALIDHVLITRGSLKRKILSFCNRSCGIEDESGALSAKTELWLELRFSSHGPKKIRGGLPDLGLDRIEIYDESPHNSALHAETPLLSMDVDALTSDTLCMLGLRELAALVQRQAKECQPALRLWRQIKGWQPDMPDAAAVRADVMTAR